MGGLDQVAALSCTQPFMSLIRYHVLPAYPIVSPGDPVFVGLLAVFSNHYCRLIRPAVFILPPPMTNIACGQTCSSLTGWLT